MRQTLLFCALLCLLSLWGAIAEITPTPAWQQIADEAGMYRLVRIN